MEDGILMSIKSKTPITLITGIISITAIQGLGINVIQKMKHNKLLIEKVSLGCHGMI